MKALIRVVSLRLIALLAALSLLIAPAGAHAQGASAFSQQELEQMMAPIALYPDPLLSQILLAATYPMEVLEAARWSREQPDLSADEAVRAAASEDWDPSVKSLVAFPQVLASLAENPQWTQSLGDAFLAQPAQVMDTVQELRRRAQAAGGLGSDDHVSLVASGPDLLLQPLDPGIIHVPYYDPLVVFGSWRWPAYPPIYLRPWQRHYTRPGYARGTYWGPPVAVSAGFFFGAFDWPRRQLRVVQHNKQYYSRGRVAIRPTAPNRAPGAWRHEAEIRAGNGQGGAAAAQRFGALGAPQNQNRRIGINRPEERMERRAVVPPQARSQAHFDGRRDARVGTRPAAPALVIQAAPVVAPQVRPGARFDGRHPTRISTPTAPAPQPATRVQTAPVARLAPAPRPAPAALPAVAAPPAAAAPPAQAGHARRQSAGHEARARHEEQRAGDANRDSRRSQAAARPGAGANPGARPLGVR